MLCFGKLIKEGNELDIMYTCRECRIELEKRNMMTNETVTKNNVWKYFDYWPPARVLFGLRSLLLLLFLLLSIYSSSSFTEFLFRLLLDTDFNDDGCCSAIIRCKWKNVSIKCDINAAWRKTYPNYEFLAQRYFVNTVKISGNYCRQTTGTSLHV